MLIKWTVGLVAITSTKALAVYMNFLPDIKTGK